MSQDAARRLRRFLEHVRVTLDTVREDSRILPDHERAELNRLWTDAASALTALDGRLKEIEQGSKPELQRALADAGLEGDPLDVKLAAVDRALSAFRKARVAMPPRPRRQTPRGGRCASTGGGSADALGVRPGSCSRTWRPCLRWIDVPLESLVAALGQGERLKEVKKWLEAAVADARELPPTP